jgi:hypothetical protein
MGILFACLFALMAAAPLSAQQEPQEGQDTQDRQEAPEAMPYTRLEWRDLAFSAGLGAEANGYPRGWKTKDDGLPGLGLGGLFMLDVQWSPAFAAGLKGSYNTNFQEYTAWDGLALFRWYFLQSFAPFERTNNFFVQAEGGIVFQREPFATDKHDPYEVVQGWGGGLVIGTRISLKPSLYLEPYVRTGYPWLWGAGVLVGYTFHYRYAKQSGSAPPRGMRDVRIIVVNYSETPKWRSGK